MADKPSSYKHSGFQGLIGVAREDITPPVGIYARSWGAATHEVAEGIHRPLTATALTLQQNPDDPPLVLIAADLGWWRSPEDERYVRGAVLEAFHLDPANVMIAGSHTHAGPSIARDDADKPGGELVAPYLETMRSAFVTATRRALENRVPAVLEWATGRCDLAQNRDLPDPEAARYICGFHAEGPADDTLLVGRVTAENGAALATIVHYACHPTTLAWENRLISPDYIGALRETVEAQTEGAPCLYLHGASGELAPREQYTADTAIPDAHGRKLGYATLATLEGMLPPCTRLAYAGITESGAPLAVWQREPQTVSTTLAARLAQVELPLQPTLPGLAEIDRQLAACQDPVLAERLLRKRRIRRAVGEGKTTPMPLWVWKVGEAFLVGQPNEAYSLLQTELRRRFPQAPLAVMNVVNGHFGYLPPAELYDHEIYPVWQSPFDRGSLDQVLEAAAKIVENLS